MTLPERQFLLTRWSTIVFADAAGALHHGDFHGAPRNVFLSPDGMLHTESGPPLAVEIVPSGHGILYGLKHDGRFFCADSHGGFSASRSWLDDWERCLLINEERDQDIMAILENDWTLADGEIVSRTQITLDQNFIMNFGTRKLNLAEHADALIFERAGAHVSAICFIASGWQVCTARRFQPLIYFAIFGADHIFEMLSLSLESILLFGDYRGKIFILCDRDAEQLAPFIPEALAARIITGRHHAETYHDKVMGRYEIADQPVDEFQPLLYLDVDTICNAPLSRLLAVCTETDIFYSSSEHGVTVDKMEDWLGEWFGRSMFTAAGLKLSNIHGLNSGTLVFSNTHFARPILNGIKTGFAQYKKDFPKESWKGDQPFVSFFLQSQKFVDPTRLNEFIRYKRHNYKAGEPETGLVHFNFGVGFDKTQAMADYLNELKAAHLPPETSSIAPVV